jgi:hypothetical protein
MSSLFIGHIVNPVAVKRSRDLYTAQPITFESMKIAKEYARGEVDVRQYASFYPEDERIVPPYFEKTPVLQRSIGDIKSFKVRKKLPLIKDILDRLYEACNADYFIYTNVDIALMPFFYLTVKKIIENGYDGFLINRRTLSQEYHSIDQLPLMYADFGETHPGHDCFVFKREIYPWFILGRSCPGVSRFARFLMANIIAFSQRYMEFKQLHATFHIGDDRNWNGPDYNEYYYHHVPELVDVFKKLEASPHVVRPGELMAFYQLNIKQIWGNAANYPDTGYLETVPKKDEL